MKSLKIFSLVMLLALALVGCEEKNGPTGGMAAQQEFAFVARYGVTYDEGTLEPNTPGGWL